MRLHVLSDVICFPYSRWNRHRKRGICICTGVHQSLIGLCFLSGVMNWVVVIRLQENWAAVRFRSGLGGLSGQFAYKYKHHRVHLHGVELWMFVREPERDDKITERSTSGCFLKCKIQEGMRRLPRSYGWLSWRGELSGSHSVTVLCQLPSVCQSTSDRPSGPCPHLRHHPAVCRTQAHNSARPRTNGTFQPGWGHFHLV